MKKKTIVNLKNILQFIQDSFDDFITILLWVILWSIIEPYIIHVNLIYKITIVVLIIIFLNKRLLKFPTSSRKYKKKRITNKEIAEKIDNLNNRV